MVLVCTYTVAVGDDDTDGDQRRRRHHDSSMSLNVILGPLGQRANVQQHSGFPDNANHKIDGVKPTLSSANASGDLTKVVLTFSEAIGTVDNTKITVKKGGTDQTTTGAAIDSTNSTKVEITLMTAFLSTDTNITVELAADAVKDVPGNGIDAVSSGWPSASWTTPRHAFVSAGGVADLQRAPGPDSIPTSAWAIANEILSATLTVKDTGAGFLG